MTKYVVSGYIGFDNFGDEAIAGVLVEYLKSIGAEKITLISANPSKTSKIYGVESCKMLDFFKSILESDVLISGGGSLLQDITSLKSLLYYLVIIMSAIAFNKKVIIFAQGFTPFRTKIGKFLTKFVLKKCDIISVRDLKSAEILNKMGIKSTLCADPVFGINIPKTQKKEGIGIQLRNFPTLTDNFLECLADNIAQKFPDKCVKLISLQDSLDLVVIQKFSQMLKMRNIEFEIIKNLNVKDAIFELSNLEYLIGMRFHACLVAAKAGVKVIGINYDIKVHNLAIQVGFPIIGLLECDINTEINKLFELNPNNYQIPTFNFDNIIQ